MARLKFRGNKDGGFTLPPEGTYDLQIVSIKADETSNEGDPQVVVQFEIIGGPQAGSKFRQYYTLNEDRSWVFLKLLKAAGVDYSVTEGDGENDDEFDLDPDELLQCYLRARLTHYHNEAKNKTYINMADEQASKLSDSGSDDTSSEAESDGASDEPPTERRRRRP